MHETELLLLTPGRGRGRPECPCPRGRPGAGHDGVVAPTAHALIGGLPWAAAFALSAIVAPTDPLAATAIARRLGVPRRIVTLLEGEALVNDATALVAYRIAMKARSAMT